jgi:dihydrofolate reductase
LTRHALSGTFGASRNAILKRRRDALHADAPRLLCKKPKKKPFMISLIVAAADNNVIGHLNVLPWYLSRDLKNYKALTVGHTVIVGRKTFDSIMARLGKPLPDRKTVIITRQTDFVAPPECVAASSFEDALEKTKGEELFVSGGEAIYEMALPYVDRLYLTRVHVQSEGDIELPIRDFSEWKLVHEEQWPKDDKNEYDATYQVYERVHA